jgi:hypothetical protein
MGLFVWEDIPSKVFVGDIQPSKIFVWDTKVRPKEVFELTTNIRWQTLSWLRNLGWDGITYGVSSYSLDTNHWLMNGNWNGAWASLNFNLSGHSLVKKKITLYSEWNISSLASQDPNTGNVRIRLTDWTSSSIIDYASLTVNGGSPSVSMGWFYVNGEFKMPISSRCKWNYTSKLEMNLKTWDVAMTVTWNFPFSWNYTMTSTEISYVLNSAYIMFFETNYNGNIKQSLYLASIKIEDA